MAPKTITVIGSLNSDLSTTTRRLPKPGETLTSTSFHTASGGKGANQAVAACRLSRNCHQAPSQITVKMVGCVGQDPFGAKLKEDLSRDGVDVMGVAACEGETTGVAVIIVDEGTSENRILVYPGANARLTKDLFPDVYFAASSTDLLVMQLETPLQTTLRLLTLADEAGVPTVFNPAPAVSVPVGFYKKMTHLIVNETEAALLTGEEVEGLDEEAVAHQLLRRGVKGSVVVTLGGEGGFWVTPDDNGRWKVDKGEVVDTTGAGDTFVGAFAVKIVEGASVREAVQWAAKAAGRKVRKRGAMAGIPWRGEVDGVVSDIKPAPSK